MEVAAWLLLEWDRRGLRVAFSEEHSRQQRSKEAKERLES